MPEPLGPMMAWTSPGPMVRSMPLRIGLPSTVACRLLISSKCHVLILFALTDAAFEADADQFLRFDREFHRQCLQHFLAETVHDQRHGFFFADAALQAIKQLVIADFARGRFMLDLATEFWLRYTAPCAPRIVADQQAVALGIIAAPLAPAA